MHCTQCGQAGDGRFCGGCGATLVAMDCPSCSAPTPMGRRFCVECGSALQRGTRGPTPVAPTGSASPDNQVAWWVAGALLVILLAVGGWSLLSDDTGTGAALGPMQGPQPGALGPAPNIDLASMTPREAADRLFDRVMGALAQRDTVEVINFLPMAIDAYELARPLDLDGLFHLSLLQRAGMRYDEALATAQEALDEDPDHLLNLSAAAEAARELGREELAAQYFGHFLEVWEVESARTDREEYQEHAPLMPSLLTDATEFMQERGL